MVTLLVVGAALLLFVIGFIAGYTFRDNEDLM